MSKILKKIFFLLLLGAAVMLAGCSSDDDSGPVLTGTWIGQVYNFPAAESREITVVIDGVSITSVSLDGVNQNLTGTISPEQGSVYSFILSDGTEGGFMINGIYAGFSADDGTFGAVTNGGTSGAPTFSVADLAGKTAGGFSVDIDGAGDVTLGGGSSATCDGNIICTGPDGFGNTFTVDLDYFASSNDFYGPFTSTAGDSGNVQLNLSYDKRFAAAAACASFSTLPYSCTYSIWIVN